MNTLAERLRSRRLEMGLTQKQLADKAGIAQNTLSSLENGVRQGTRAIGSLADALHCRALWLEKGVGPQSIEVAPTPSDPNVRKNIRPVAIWNNEDELPEDQFVFVPCLDIKASAGAGTLIWEIDEKSQRQAMTIAWARRQGVDPGKLVSLQADGDSMEPRIFAGDSLTVDMTTVTVDAIQSGRVYVFVLDEEWYVKRLYRQIDGSVLVHSENESKYPRIVLLPERASAMQIVGRVIAVSSAVL